MEKSWNNEDELVREVMNGYKVNLRQDTTDYNCMKEVLVDRTYRNTRAGEGGFDVDAGEHWVDFGGNIGAFGLYCASRGATCESYEPDEENIGVLRRNYALNGLDFKSHQTAVSTSKKKELVFYKGGRSGDRYRYSLKPNKQNSIIMPNMHMSKVNFKGVNGLKMDIEGAELDILDQELIPETLDKLVMEYHITKDRSMENFWRRMAYLETIFDVVYYLKSFRSKDYFKDNIYPHQFDQLVYCKKLK